MRLVDLEPVDPGISEGARTPFTSAVASGFSAAKTMGTMAESDRHAEIYGGWRPIIDEIAQGFLEPPEDIRAAIFGQGLEPDAETLGRMMEWTSSEDFRSDRFPITPEMSPEAVMERRDQVYARDKAEVERQQEILSRASPFARTFGGGAGAIGAEVLDPVNVASMALGAPAKTGLLGFVLIEAGIGAAIEALQTPQRNEVARRLDQEEIPAWMNAAFGALFGGGFALTFKGAAATGRAALRGAKPIGDMSLRAIERMGRAVPDRRALIELAEASGDPEATFAAQSLRTDLEDESAAVSDGDQDGITEHNERLEEATNAAIEGRDPVVSERPTFGSPRPSIVSGLLQEFTPDQLEFEAGTFQWKTDTTGADGQRGVLDNQDRFDPTLAGPVFVYERSDGRLIVVDGHQRTGLAKRAQAGGQDVRMSGYVYREADGWTQDQVFARGVIADLSQREEFASGMVRDAARALRVSPDLVKALPQGPGHVRLQRILSLPDEAFDAVIHQRLEPHIAELIPAMIQNPEMQNAVSALLVRLQPETRLQAESIIAQARETPVSREVTADLFGEQEVVESLFLERAKVLERAMRIMRDDRGVFRTLDERADRIEGTGANKLDQKSNKEIRQQVEQSLAAVQKLAHRAGPISEALNDGAKSYKENGRLKDAAQTVADAVRTAIQRGGIGGLDAGQAPNAREATPSRAETPEPLDGFADPVEGEGAKAQIEATRITPEPEPRIDRLPDMDPTQSAQLWSGLTAAQAFRDIDDLMDRAARNHDDLTAQIGAAAMRAGATQKVAPLKKRERVEVKARDKYAGDLNRLTDVARGGVEVPSNEAAEAFVDALARRYRVIDEGWNFTDAGYFDRKLAVVFEDGQLGEVQIWPPGMLDAKEVRGGHKLYEISRDLTQSEEARAKATQDMIELYGGVRDDLPPSWRAVLGDQDGIDAPDASTTDINNSSGTSGEPSSPSTSRGSTSDQEPSEPSSNIAPGSGSSAGMERSTRKNLMGDTSNTDIGASAGAVKSERTSAGDQTLIEGVEPITDRTRLEERAAQPLARDGAQESESQIGGLFDPYDPARTDLFDQVPTGRGFDEDGNEIALTRSRAEIAAELDADDEAVEVLDLCVKG